MSRNYYYLVSGLPDLVLDESKNVVEFNAFVQEVQEELTEEDFEVIRSLRLPVDNANLISVLESKKKEFDPRGNFSKEQIESAERSPEELPEYMQVFIRAYRDNRQLYSGLVAADQLNWLFYEAMSESKSEYIRDWFSFDLNLRNVLAAVNCRKHLEHVDALAAGRDGAAAFTIIGRNEIAEAILRSTASDFGLSAALPWLERVLALSKGGLTVMEKGIDELRWEMADELTPLSYFGVETVAAFTIKLMLVERWAKLDAAVGRSKLERLVEELKNSFSVPAGF
ncbi:MAG: DUF2764 family protein [Chitinispirillaceae bacterium]